MGIATAPLHLSVSQLILSGTRWIFLCIVLLPGMYLQAAEPQISVEKDGQFETKYQLAAKSCANRANEVADYLINDFRHNTGHLFEWALKDLGLQSEKNEMTIVYKTSTYDAKSNVTSGYFDILIPGIKTFRDVRVDAIVRKTAYTSGVIKASVDIIYSSLLLKKATAALYFVPRPHNDMILISESKMDFGWFFNLFITQKRYKSIVEWRIIKFTRNMRDECVKRQQGSEAESAQTDYVVEE